MGRLQWGALGALHTRGTCSVLRGRCCAGRGGWAVAGPLGPRGALQGERGRAKLGPAGRLTGKVFSPPLWPQPWPQGSEQEACPSAAALQAGAISGASATLLTARGAARSHAQEASPCHGSSGLEMETGWAAGMVGRHGSQRGHRHPERRRLRLGFTEGRAVQGRKEAPRPAGRLWGSQGDFCFLFAGLVCPRPPPPPPSCGGQSRASGGSVCSNELAISGRRLAFQNALFSSYKSRPGRHGHGASPRMQGLPETQPWRGSGCGGLGGPPLPRPLRSDDAPPLPPWIWLPGSGTLGVCRARPEPRKRTASQPGRPALFLCLPVI